MDVALWEPKLGYNRIDNFQSWALRAHHGSIHIHHIFIWTSPSPSHWWLFVIVLLWIALVGCFKWERGRGRSGRLCVNNWHLIFKQWPNSSPTPCSFGNAHLSSFVFRSLTPDIQTWSAKYLSWIVRSIYFPLPHPIKTTRWYCNCVQCTWAFWPLKGQISPTMMKALVFRETMQFLHLTTAWFICHLSDMIFIE